MSMVRMLCSRGVKGTAVPASARFLAAVELLEDRRKVTHNALEPHFRSMHEIVAVWAIPFKGVQRALGARHLDHKSDSVGLTLRRVANMLGKKENLSFLNGDVLWRLAGVLDDAQKNVALELVEELLSRIVMIVAALVRATDNSDHELAVFPHLRVTNGRLQFVPVFVYPALQVERFQGSDGRHSYSFFLALSLSMGLVSDRFHFNQQVRMR